MTTITYSTVDDILDAYAAAFDCSYQEARDQLRTLSGLEGAIARPQHYALYADADLALQAAVLAHGIAEGQVFFDGNKRVALLSMVDFLEENGYTVTASQPDRAGWILRMAPPDPDLVDPPPRATPEAIAVEIAACLVPLEASERSGETPYPR